MAKEKSLVEEAIIQMKNLEEAVAENAKGILASTMKQEIKDLVKESLSEQEDEDEIESDDVEMDEPTGSDDIADIDMGDDSDEEEDEMDTDDMEFDDEEDDMDFDDEEEEDDMDFDDEEDEEDVIDLTDADDDEVLKVFQLMGPDDNIVVQKDDEGNIHLKDDETGKEYMIVGESEDDKYSFDEEYGEDFGNEFNEEDEEDERIEDIVGRMFDKKDDYEDSDSDFDLEKDDLDEIVYEIQMDGEDDFKFDLEEDSLYESKKMSIKPKGVGIGTPKFKYNAKPNQGTGFKTKMKQGPKSVGTGRAKFEYKEGENLKGDFKNVKKPVVKKEETKEAVRTLSAGKYFRDGGLPKPRAHSKFNTAIKENTSNSELQILREKNEEYRKALNVFRNKLNEVAIFNSNLAYATRLFTEHSTSKQEKINILRRFDSVETIKESKNLYQIVKNELSGNNKAQTMNESIERTIAKSPSTGAVNLIESKTYENPQFLRMKDLMAKIK